MLEISYGWKEKEIVGHSGSSITELSSTRAPEIVDGVA